MKFHGNWNMEFLGIPRKFQSFLVVRLAWKKIPRNSTEFLGILTKCGKKNKL